MKLTETDLESLHSIAMNAAATAAIQIQIASAGEIAVMRKTGGSTEASQVLTEVDLASEKLILETLQPFTEKYELGVLTEETEDDSSRHRTDYFWCIDPIDGTLPFIKGDPGYSVVIALVSREGVPQLGVIWDVVANLPYHARRGSGVFRASDPIQATVSESPTRLSWFMDRSMVAQPNFPEWQVALEKLAQRLGLEGVEIIDHAGAALNAAWAITNAPAVYFKCPREKPGGGSVWDFAASACLYEALGLPVSDLSGQPLNLNPEGCTFMHRTGVLYASDPTLAQAVREIHAELG